MRLIDADALKAEFLGNFGEEVWHYTGVRAVIDVAPTIDAEPVRHGHWIHTGVKNVFGGHQHKCSMCGYSLMVSPICDSENYCCSCGAKMDEVSE